MAEPFLAEIRMFSFENATRGWLPCEGQKLPINQNQALFALLGTTYGGDGRVNFALPDLRARAPIGVGEQHPQGQVSTGCALGSGPTDRVAMQFCIAVEGIFPSQD